MAKQDEVVFDFSEYHTPFFYKDLKLDENERNKEKFIKSVEKFVRTSLEYRNYIKYLRTDAHLNYCDLFDRLPEDIIANISIEMHHFPFTLYDIVEIVLNKYIKGDKTFTRLSISNEVMDLHYSNMVGLVPLTVTAHQIMHAGGKFVHKDNIFGNFMGFFQKYNEFFEDSHNEKLTMILKLSKSTIEEDKRKYLSFNKEIFKAIDHSDYPNVNIPELPDEVETPETSTDMEDITLGGDKRKNKKKPVIIEENDVMEEESESTISPVSEKQSTKLADEFE